MRRGGAKKAGLPGPQRGTIEENAAASRAGGYAMTGPKASAIALLLALLLAESGLSAPPADAPRLDRHGDPLPPGAIARLGTLRLRHPGPVYAVAVSPDGKLLASSGGDRGVRLWRMATERVAGRLEGELGEVRWIAFSPDSRTLVLGDNQPFVRLWDAATRKEIDRLGRNVPVPGAPPPQFGEGRGGGPREVFEGHQSGVRSAAFAPDGKTLVTASEDVRVWDLATRKTVR